MKKTLAIIGLIITFFIIYFLQANLFTWFTIAGVRPNLFIILLLFIGLFVGKKVGFILGILFGLYIDFLTGMSVGTTAFLLGIIGLVAEYLDKSFSKDSRITIIIMVSVATIIYEIVYYIFKVFRWGIRFEIISFIKILLLEILFNIILTIILYPIIQIVGNKLEDIFKNKKVLMRFY